MFRFLFISIVFCLFFGLVILGVNQSLSKFNAEVLPAKPIKTFSLKESRNGIVQIDLMQEQLVINKRRLQAQGLACLAEAQQKIDGWLGDPRLKETIQWAKNNAKAQIAAWRDSEKVKAVNWWVRERISRL